MPKRSPAVQLDRAIEAMLIALQPEPEPNPSPALAQPALPSWLYLFSSLFCIVDDNDV